MFVTREGALDGSVGVCTGVALIWRFCRDSLRSGSGGSVSVMNQPITL